MFSDVFMKTLKEKELWEITWNDIFFLLPKYRFFFFHDEFLSSYRSTSYAFLMGVF